MKRTGTILLAAVLALSAPAGAAADGYASTPLTASAIFKKAEAAYGERAPGTYMEIAQIQGDGGWTRTTIMDGENYRTSYEGGGFTSAVGSYKGQDWSQDENGVVTYEGDFHAQVNPNDLALDHPDDPKYNVHVLGITQTAPRQYVVEVNPPGGFDQLRYYDASSFLLARVVSYTRDRYRHVTDYEDYRNAFGEMKPYRIHSYDGRTSNDRVTTIASFGRIPSSTDLSVPQATGVFGYAGTAPLELPARFTPNGIILRAFVNGRGLDFLLDSGAAGLFIDPGVVHELGLTPFGRSTETVGGGDVDLGMVRLAHMSIGSLNMDNVVFTTSPMSEQAGDARIVGLIGFDFLASGIVGIDFKAQKLTIYPRDRFDPKAMGLIGLPLQLDDSIPRTDAWVEGVHGHFLVDTGAFSLLVYKDFANRLPSVVAVNNQSAIGTVGGTMSSRVVSLSNLVFGGIRFDTALAMEPQASTFDIDDYDGLIGRDVLAKYQSYFDYGDGFLYVKPNL